MSDIVSEFKVDSGGFGVKLTQDVEPILQEVERYRQANPRKRKGFYKKASFPMVLVKAYMFDKGITFEEFVNNEEHIKNMYNDPALSRFRTYSNA